MARWAGVAGEPDPKTETFNFAAASWEKRTRRNRIDKALQRKKSNNRSFIPNNLALTGTNNHYSKRLEALWERLLAWDP